MRGSDFVYIDIRWREDGWLEAMRLRLTGWLPERLAARGNKKGVFETSQKKDGKHIALTARGIALTDPGPHSFTSQNLQLLADYLIIHDFSRDWLRPAGDTAIKFKGPMLDENYRNSLLEHLHTAAKKEL
ncbi:hypothetical protein [Roseivivax sp. THAF40]|uniref:hypothetical protein n=1 Tax=Roseivivax sp. THAF40 TaxID=2587858 RepID=UPI00126966C8|nr:hypothetical protein [Roseivivax sp. THAF40]